MVKPLTALSYINIVDRASNLEEVRKALEAVINSQPTQIHPTERELYLDAIITDIDDQKDAPWTQWPEELYTLALTAIKTLGRNPVGSEILLTPNPFSTLLFHSALPFPLDSPVNSPPQPDSPPALESLKILANLLVLHAAGRNKFANVGGAKAVARALAGKDVDGNDTIISGQKENIERLFLLGRLGFLVTMDRTRAVELMVDHEDIVASLVYYLSTVPCVAANYNALSELQKMTNNVVRFYPHEPSQGSTSDITLAESDPWDERFDQLLYPVLCLLYTVPFIDLAPPLSHIVHTLLSIPFLPRLLHSWHSVPEPISPSTSSSGSMKAFLNKLSNMSTSSASIASASTSNQPRETISALMTKNKSPPTSPRPSTSSLRRPVVPRSSVDDSTALPNRLIRILSHFFETHLPYPKKPDDPIQGIVLDEALPPLLLVLTRAAAGSEPIRKHLRETLLPPTLDRSSTAGPLESRKGLLGDLLRLVGCAGHHQTRDSARELMWNICNRDATTLSVEIGYGNAAGILFQKGISGPPPASIEEIPDDFPSASSSTERNPITSLRDIDDGNDIGLNNMTQEEKEREAERLFVLFDRMEKNPVISMKSNREGEGKVNVKDIMREKLEKGEVEEWDKMDEEEDRRKREEEDEKDEREAIRQMKEYRKRIGKK